VTEAEWLACGKSELMFDFLQRQVTERRLRLWACGCCRSIWHLITDPISRVSVEMAERFADGEAALSDLEQAHSQALQVTNEIYVRCDQDDPVEDSEYDGNWGHEVCVDAAAATSAFAKASSNQLDDLGDSARRAARAVAHAIAPYRFEARQWPEKLERRAAQAVERNVQASLLRDIFGNPFRPVAFSPEWRTDTALSLAKQMYDAREFSAMPILADALQDAGCDNEGLLSHCRDTAQPHVRGCWVVDAVLNKV
jgi:hypothetical protein